MDVLKTFAIITTSTTSRMSLAMLNEIRNQINDRPRMELEIKI